MGEAAGRALGGRPKGGEGWLPWEECTKIGFEWLLPAKVEESGGDASGGFAPGPGRGVLNCDPKGMSIDSLVLLGSPSPP